MMIHCTMRQVLRLVLALAVVTVLAAPGVAPAADAGREAMSPADEALYARLPIKKPAAQLTSRERRNLHAVIAWADSYTLPGGSMKHMIEDLYADKTEGVLVLQKWTVTGPNGEKDFLRDIEVKMEKDYQSRRIEFDSIYPSDDTVTMEIRSVGVTVQGQPKEFAQAIFLTFDDSARIIKDHSYGCGCQSPRPTLDPAPKKN